MSHFVMMHICIFYQPKNRCETKPIITIANHIKTIKQIFVQAHLVKYYISN